MTPKKKLSDIVKDMAGLKRLWENTQPAADPNPVPRGSYECDLVDITPDQSGRGTPRLKITLLIRTGEYAGRSVWHDAYLTEAAMPFTIRLLQKIGLSDLDEIEKGLPKGIVVQAQISLRLRDDKSEFNELRDWELITLPPDTSTDSPSPSSPPTIPTTSLTATAAATPWDVDLETLDKDTPPKGDDDDPTSFNYGANAQGGDL